MADDRLNEAIDIVARDLIAKVVRDIEDEWDAYPEIGEHDWQRVLARVRMLCPQVDGEMYAAAYSFLDARADAE